MPLDRIVTVLGFFATLCPHSVVRKRSFRAQCRNLPLGIVAERVLSHNVVGARGVAKNPEIVTMRSRYIGSSEYMSLVMA